MIQELLAQRNLPLLMQFSNGEAVSRDNWEVRRKELVEILGETIYGVMPPYSGPTTWKEEVIEDYMAAGKGETRKVEITFPLEEGKEFTFPVRVISPVTATKEAPKAAIVFISFGRYEFYPIEEVVENEVIVAEIVMNDIAPDREDHFANGLSAVYYKDGVRWPNGFGKIGMWAYCASKTLDYLLSKEFVDPEKIGVLGHSRTGKTALWAGANDTRFTHVFANASGCMGAAITRKKGGETAPDIYRQFPYWFSQGFGEYAASVESSETAPLDQHFLLAAIAPRKLYVGHGLEDTWADYISEYLCCAAASPAWECNGVKGFVHPDRLSVPGDHFTEGNIGYHLREGKHFLSRHDWNKYCDFLKNH